MDPGKRRRRHAVLPRGLYQEPIVLGRQPHPYLTCLSSAVAGADARRSGAGPWGLLLGQPLDAQAVIAGGFAGAPR